MVKLVALLSLVAPITCFLDTGSLYVNRKLPEHYIVDSKNVVDLINNECGQFEGVDKFSMYRVYDLEQPAEGSFIKHVQYDSAANLDDLVRLCQLDAEITTVDSVNDIMDDIAYKKDELVVVQQVPKFQKREVVEDVYDEYAEDMKTVSKAETQTTAESEADEVHILDDVNTKKTGHNGSLFNTYQFFTPGIFMCLIVTFFLVFIMVNALSWIGAIEITYQSFEKQVDLEKKNE